MSSNPFDPAAQPGQPGQPDHSGQPTEPSLFAQPGAPTSPVTEPAPAARRTQGRTVALVGGILAIVAVGAAGAFAFQQVGGGGAQPESVLPANTFAFAKVDLDPSAGQKVDAIRFIRKFPDAQGEVKEDSDLREVIVKGLQKDGQLEGVDYAKDVEPWLGQRIGIGLVPGATADAEPTAVVALAVTDEAKARASLPKIAKAAEGECRIVEEFALCTEATDQLDAVAAAVGKGTLADSANFSKDMGDLGEDGIAASWVDLGKASALSKNAGDLGFLGGFRAGAGSTDVQGRLAVALRFDGPHLELAGHTNGSSVKFAGSKKGVGLGGLPEGTLAAVSIANAGDQLKQAWPQVEEAAKGAAGEQEFADGLAQIEDELGISVPDDLYAALGSQFSLVFGGMGEGQSELRVAAVTDGDRAVLQKLADAGQEMGVGALTLEPAGGTTVLSLSEGYADVLGKDHGLGDTARFKDAVRDADSARVAGYVDIAGLVTEFKDEIGADEAKNFAGLSALGFTVSGEGNSADFSLRLTTR